MINQFIKNTRVSHWLFAFIFIHITAWTLVPSWVRFTLPMDSIEGAIWGQQLEWGYDKNPFMNGWLTRLAIKIGEHSDWVIYLFSQLSVAVCFWAVWQLSKKMLPPLYALVSVLLLEGSQYYSFHAIDFNDNTLELGVWALTILFFYQALQENKLRHWLLTGFLAGIGMMIKYYTILLLAPMILLLLRNTDTRQHFYRPPLYIALVIFSLVIAPHVWWLFHHDFITLKYAFGRVASTPAGFNHCFFPAQFAWQQFEVILPVLFLLFFLFLGEKPLRLQPPLHINRFDKEFLLLVGMGPFLLTILLAAVTGIKLRAGWGQPLFSLGGMIAIVWLQPYLTATKFYRFVTVVFCFLALTVSAYSIALIRADQPSSANYPGKIIAATLTQRWHEKYHTPIKYVAGSRWLAGNIAFYSNDHPQVFIDWDPRYSPWIDETKLKHDGAIFVWDLTDDQRIAPDIIKARFHSINKIELLRFTWLRNKRTPPVEILIAFLPPL
jgi:4-amino-4-deoxy-L-arabinose transferase-like glycosyltransferase